MNRDREIRRYLLAPGHTAWIYSGPGIAGELHDELVELLPRLLTPAGHLPRLKRRRDGVIVENIEYRSLLEIVLRSTTAQQVSLQLASERIQDVESVDRLLAKARWGMFFDAGAAVVLRADSRGSTIYHERLILEHAREALSAAGIETRGREERPGAPSVAIRIERDRGRVELSLSGAPLWQRGYRARLEAVAPLREDLAQAAVRAAARLDIPVSSRATARHVDGDSPTDEDRPGGGGPTRRAPCFPGSEALIVPFCGTGTLLFEYLVCRFSIPPCRFRRDYAFSSFACEPPPSVDWVRRRLESLLAERLSSADPISAVLLDTSEQAFDVARENFAVFSAALPGRSPVNPVWLQGDALTVPWIEHVPHDAEAAFVPLNPPYGRRLSVGSRNDLYRRVAARCDELSLALKAGGQPRPLRGFILCPDEASWSVFLSSTPNLSCETSHFSQGGMDVRLVVFTSRSVDG